MLRERRCEEGNVRFALMGLQGGIFLEILQLIKFSELNNIGPHCSNMHTPMSKNVTFVKGVVEDKLNQQDH